MDQKAAHWSVSEAKARLSEVLSRAQEEPQVIENRGRELAVVIDIESYRALQQEAQRATPRARISELLRVSEAVRSEGGAELELPDRASRPSPFDDEAY